jgi:hypothetical protein
MVRLLVKFLAQAAIVAWPLVLPVLLGFSFVQSLPFRLVVDGKTELEPGVRILLSLLGLAAAFAYDTYEYYEPRRRAERFNKEYVETVVFEEFRQSVEAGNVELGDDVRINALMARRPPTVFPRYFSWLVWDGYSYSQGLHPDQGMWLLGRQGLSGQVLKRKKILDIDLRSSPVPTFTERYLTGDRFRLRWWQLDQTKHLTYILSVPMLKTTSPKPKLREKVVGVFNIDAVSDEGATWIAQNREKLGKFLRRHGKVLAELA